MMDHRVSIVIPCYNDDPAHVLESVSSAQSQSYGDVEVVIVNDGSTRTDTIDTLNSLSDVRLIHQANAGPGAALNAGIRASSGDLILPLGADDRINDDFLEHCVPQLLASDDVVGVYPLVEFFGLREGVAGAPETVRFEDILVRNTVVATTLYRREHWSLVGGYGEVDDCSEDWYFFALLLGRTGGCFIREPRAKFYYRIRAGSRNSVNRAVDRKVNLRRRLSTALPERLPDMYLAAASQADAAIAEADKYGSYVRGWRRRLRPVMPAYYTLQRLRGVVRGPRG